MKYDVERVRRLLEEQNQALDKLQELASTSKEDFLADPHLIGSAKYHFIVAIETAIDLCNHLISENRLRSPEDYADCFRVMEEAGVFDATLASRLVSMARFRNRLVHLYWNVDDSQVHDILGANLGDFEEFEQALLSGIKAG